MPMLTTWRTPLRRRVVAHRLGEGEHRVEHRMHLAANGALPAWRAQRGMQHGAALGGVDRRAGEHRVALRLDAAFARQVGEEAQRRRVDEVLRQVGEDLGRVERQRLEAAAGRARTPRAGRSRGRAPRSGRRARPRRGCGRSASMRQATSGACQGSWSCRGIGAAGASEPVDVAEGAAVAGSPRRRCEHPPSPRARATSPG